jgi:hypothetical protein
MITLGDGGFTLCFWEKLSPADKLCRMDRNRALSLLRRSQSDIWVQASLRRLVASRLPPTALVRLNDEQVREAVADMIASGQLVLVYSVERQVQGLAGVPKRAASAPPPPRPASQTSSPPPPADPTVFPANINAAAQAAANQQAAQQGAPFCLQ